MDLGGVVDARGKGPGGENCPRKCGSNGWSHEGPSGDAVIGEDGPSALARKACHKPTCRDTRLAVTWETAGPDQRRTKATPSTLPDDARMRATRPPSTS